MMNGRPLLEKLFCSTIFKRKLKETDDRCAVRRELLHRLEDEIVREEIETTQSAARKSAVMRLAVRDAAAR